MENHQQPNMIPRATKSYSSLRTFTQGGPRGRDARDEAGCRSVRAKPWSGAGTPGVGASAPTGSGRAEPLTLVFSCSNPVCGYPVLEVAGRGSWPHPNILVAPYFPKIFRFSCPASPSIDQHWTIFSSSNFQPRTSNLCTPNTFPLHSNDIQ